MPIILYNSPQFQTEDKMYGGLKYNSYFFTIRIEPNYVVYELIKNNVSSFGAAREGTLIFGMSIPRGYRLWGGQSPYDVLVKLKDTFISRCMICKDTVSDTYAYNNVYIDSKILDDVLSGIMLEPQVGPYRSMNMATKNIGVVTATEPQIRELLNDVHYSAFAEYSEIIIAQNVAPECSYSRINISIPRKSQYELFENNVRTRTINGDYEPITCIGREKSEYYINSEVTFTIAELKSGKTINGVSIDTMNEVINVNLHALSTPRTQKVYVEVSPKAASKNVVNDFVVYYDGINLPLAPDGSFTLTGRELARLEIDKRDRFMVRYNGTKYFVSESKICDDNKLHIILTENKGGSNGGYTGGSVSSGSITETPAQPANFSEFSVIIPEEYARIAADRGVIEAACRIYSSNYSEGDRPKQSVFENVQKGRNGYEFIIAVNRKLLSKGVYLEITIGNKVIKSERISDRSKTTIDYFNEKRGSKKKSKGGKFMKIILLLFLGMVIGAATGTLVTYYMKSMKTTYQCPEEGCKDYQGKQLEFSSEQDLINHYIYNHHEQRYTCNKCPNEYDNLSDLNKHIITEEKRCPICLELLTIDWRGNYTCKSCSISYSPKTDNQTSGGSTKQSGGGTKYTVPQPPPVQTFECAKCGQKIQYDGTENARRAHYRGCKGK